MVQYVRFRAGCKKKALYKRGLLSDIGCLVSHIEKGIDLFELLLIFEKSWHVACWVLFIDVSANATKRIVYRRVKAR